MIRSDGFDDTIELNQYMEGGQVSDLPDLDKLFRTARRIRSDIARAVADLPEKAMKPNAKQPHSLFVIVGRALADAVEHRLTAAEFYRAADLVARRRVAGAP